jgi:raffinose/stachyose/melibiose transport system permease protein
MAPALAVYIIYVLYPILETLRISFYDWNGTQSSMKFIGLSNYTHLFSDDIFWKTLKNNIMVVLASVFLQIPLGLFMALMLFAPIKGRKFFQTVYFLPFLMSTVAIGYLWNFMYDPLNGLITKITTFLGLPSIPWLSNENTALFAVLLVVIWQFAPFYMILFKAAMVGIPEDLYEAASIDGANKWIQFRHITLPLLIPTIVSSSILAIVGSVKSFDLFYIMTGGGPNHATELMGTYMYKEAFVTNHMGYASSIAFMMFLIAFAITVLIQLMEYRRKKKGGFSG